MLRSAELRTLWLMTLSLLIGSGCAGAPPEPPLSYQEEPLPRARVMRLLDEEKRAVSLYDWVRSPAEGGQGYGGVALHIFTTWCRPCHKEVAQLNLLQARAPNVKVVGVCVEGRSCPRLKDFRKLTGARYELLIADQALVRGEGPYGALPSVPVTYLIDAKGRPVIRFDGRLPLSYATKLAAPLAPRVAPAPAPELPQATP